MEQNSVAEEESQAQAREFSFFTPPTFLHAEPFVPCVFQQCLQLKLSWSLLPGSISRSTECLWHSTLFAFNSFHSAPSVLNVAKYLIHFKHGGKRVLIFLTGIAGDQPGVWEQHICTETVLQTLISLWSTALCQTWCSREMPFWEHRLLLAVRLKSTNYCWGRGKRQS